jgi:hypothetical protein
LELKIKAPPKDPLADDGWMQSRRELGHVTLPVTISADETKELIDLGTVTVPLTNAPPATHSAKVSDPGVH